MLPVSGWDDEVRGDYQVPGTPFFYVIDGEGVIANAGFAGTLEQLEALVEGGAERGKEVVECTNEVKVLAEMTEKSRWKGGER